MFEKKVIVYFKRRQVICRGRELREGKDQAVMKTENFKYEAKKFRIFLIFDENTINTLDKVYISIIYIIVECMNE